MGITVISEDNLHEYMQILTSDEIFGINEDTLTSFVISDDEKNGPARLLDIIKTGQGRYRSCQESVHSMSTSLTMEICK